MGFLVLIEVFDREIEVRLVVFGVRIRVYFFFRDSLERFLGVADFLIYVVF